MLIPVLILIMVLISSHTMGTRALMRPCQVGDGDPKPESFNPKPETL